MRKSKITALLMAWLLVIVTAMTACGTDSINNTVSEQQSDIQVKEQEASQTEDIQEETKENENIGSLTEFNLSDIPDYSGDIYIEINENIPYFTENEYTTEVFEMYSDLDSLGRCGVAYANVCQELMPTEERGDISSVYPTGWEQNAYDFVDGGYIYNRSHLIAHELCGEDATVENLITGCRTFNVDGMLPFENMVADYVKETDNHVLYRVTPIFEGDNLLASGVLMEGLSVEDNGDGICFCVYVYNVEPGIVIDYATGENWAEDKNSDSSTETSKTTENNSSESSSENSEEITYVLNTNTMKFHYPDCSSVSDMNENNKEEYTGTREELIDEGYSPCGNCNP